MKRSEMLKLLKEETDNWMSPQPDNHELEMILSVLEREGMQPPQTLNKNKHEDYCSIYDGEKCDCDGVIENTWSEE